MSSVFAVVPTHNRSELLLRCLGCLQAQRRGDLHPVVVDHGSGDGSADKVAAAWPEATVLRGDGNLWWTGATNIGVRWVMERCTPGDHILTLNDDTEVNSDYLGHLLDAVDGHPRRLVGSVAVDLESGLVTDGGVAVNAWTARHMVRGVGKTPDELQAQEGPGVWGTDVLPGRGTLVPVTAFRDVGIYDEAHLPHYGADYEFSARARHGGYETVIQGTALVWSHTRSTGLNNRLRRLAWRDAARSLYSVRSPNSLHHRYYLARALVRPWQLPAYLPMDALRVVGSTLLNQLRPVR